MTIVFRVVEKDIPLHSYFNNSSDIPGPPLKPVEIKNPVQNKDNVPDRYPLIDEGMSKRLWTFCCECMDSGAGLFTCDSPMQARQAKEVIEPLLWAEDLRVTIVRNVELNVYSSSSSPQSVRVESKVAPKKGVDLDKVGAFSKEVKRRGEESLNDYFERVHGRNQ